MEEIKLDLKKLVNRVDTDRMGEFISYDESRCNGCGLCAMVCSVNLWSVKDGKARLSSKYQEFCLECAGCWEICEPGAIDFWYPKGGTGVVIEYG